MIALMAESSASMLASWSTARGGSAWLTRVSHAPSGAAPMSTATSAPLRSTYDVGITQPPASPPLTFIKTVNDFNH
jgi:hypothetical protein